MTIARNATEILLDLIAIPSVSPMSNKAVIEYARQFLDPRYWNVELHPYTDPAGVSKYNLVALTKNADGGRAELVFVCHTDTVPFDAAWHEAVKPVRREGRIYGRGSCDVKGFLACVLAAFGQIDMDELSKPLGLILTADEEVGCVGAKRLAADKAFSTRYMIIGEPTGLQPVRAGKGYGLAKIIVQGKEAHSAFPSVGRSAIYDAARVVLALEKLAAQLTQEDVDDSFQPPFSTLNVGLIEGGTAKNIVAGQCSLTVEWRPVPGQDPQRVPDLIRGLLAELSTATKGFKAELKVLRADPAFAPSDGRLLADLVSSLAGEEATTISFGSEAAHFRSLTTEVIVFGPGDMTVAHKTGEYVVEADLENCTGHLLKAVEFFCSQTSDQS